MMKIVFLDAFTNNPGDIGFEVLEALGEFIAYDRTNLDQVAERVKDADVLIVNKFIINARVLTYMPKVKYIVVAATGYNNIVIEDVIKYGVPVSNVSGYSAASVTQHVFASLLAIINKTEQYNLKVKSGRWESSEDFCFYDHSIHELNGCTLGVWGYGHIGSRVGEVAHAFGMKIIARTLDQSKPKPSYVRFVEPDEMFRTSDILSLHCPLTAATKEVICMENLLKMKKSAILINTGRGGLINETDLLRALDQNMIGGAALDVLQEEPPQPGNLLLHHPKCLITPHIAWASVESRTKLLEGVAQNISSFMSGKWINGIYKNMHFFLLCMMAMLSSELVAQDYLAGNTYFGANEYIEYKAGNFPVIISAAHGGLLEPESIADRDCAECVTVMDAFTQELCREVYEAILDKTGCHAHIIINKLHRRKLDANRDLSEGADGDPISAVAWYNFHTFLESAKMQVTKNFGKGIYIDLHGHGHEKERIELGYLLYGSELRKSDEILNTDQYIGYSSIKNLVYHNPLKLKHASLLRGSLSFGSLLSQASYPAVPSSDDPSPLIGDDYFSGGYNTERHGSMKSGTIDAIQIECNASIRFNSVKRKMFAQNLADVIIAFLSAHYFDNLNNTSCVSAAENTESLPYSIYPNPASQSIAIKGLDNNTEIIIYARDIFGNCFRLMPDSHIDVSQLAQGFYFLTIVSKQQSTQILKFIKID
ncbi:MAG: T9SS type A sorting domain-containing protein [Saprospiraceae bacterium]|nr:T9SS type A sorting domain-containing protein [Saprospiraceae bacterium]